jgi:acyl-CoA reductase-like NAD-dependent aldehyde dehydrogenase
VGDPLAPGNEVVEMGPLASDTQRRRVHSLVESARAEGATVAQHWPGPAASTPRQW